ncbi:GNAT family N-acetyltransferase [Rhizobium sp. 'Codium 1']|uniref:GNAT family N-acetyltransferase n=1 Tax=Rhizobium sp. 'Codium 1' TaxID=2940484 RepID=UPI001E5EE8DD|nr:GNAT family N-acetyltransferase [Rhizobium sp. 'Codium 1']MCC8933817.1 GNAT family N-acetyltransferase [Rhizobium sp. 'Codium 1']
MRAQMHHDATASAEELPDVGPAVLNGKAMLDTPAGELTLAIHHQMEPVEASWRQLEADPWNSLHQGYDWCRAWVQTHDHPLAIVEGRLDGQIAFLLPLEIDRQFLVRRAQLVGSPFTNFNSGLFSAPFRQAAAAIAPRDLEALFIEALHDHADLLSLTHVPLNWRGERHPLAALPHVRNQNASFQLPLAATMEESIAPLNAKSRRKKYRAQMRKLDAAGGYEHIRPTQLGEQQSLLECFFQQKAARFAAGGLPNVFQPADTQAFFRTLLESDKGGSDVPLELHAIRLKGEYEGRIAAITGLSRKGDHVICQFGSIDDSLLPDASPGELLFWLVIERSALSGAAVFDFGIGDQDYKRRWCNIQTEHHDILLPLRPAGRLAAMTHRGMARTKTLIKGNPHLYALIQRWRAMGTSGQPPAKTDD